MNLVLVTPEEDQQLTVEMQTEFKRERSPLLRLSLLYCRDRNPSRRGGNGTRIKAETEEFSRLLKFHSFLHRPRKKWTNEEHEIYEKLIERIRIKHAASIGESWEKKMIAEKEKMIFAFVNKKFRDYIARHKKKKKSSATITRSQKMGDQSSRPKNIPYGGRMAKVATKMGQ